MVPVKIQASWAANVSRPFTRSWPWWTVSSFRIASRSEDLPEPMDPITLSTACLLAQGLILESANDFAFLPSFSCSMTDCQTHNRWTNCRRPWRFLSALETEKTKFRVIHLTPFSLKLSSAVGALVIAKTAWFDESTQTIELLFERTLALNILRWSISNWLTSNRCKL